MGIAKLNSASTCMLKHKSYSISFKLKAIETAEKKSKEAAAREFAVNPKRIREWCSQKDKLVAMRKHGKSKRMRLRQQRVCHGHCCPLVVVLVLLQQQASI